MCHCTIINAQSVLRLYMWVECTAHRYTCVHNIMFALYLCVLFLWVFVQCSGWLIPSSLTHPNTILVFVVTFVSKSEHGGHDLCSLGNWSVCDRARSSYAITGDYEIHGIILALIDCNTIVCWNGCVQCKTLCMVYDCLPTLPHVYGHWNLPDQGRTRSLLCKSWRCCARGL